MIDKNKVRIMTKLAIYEKELGREDFRINKYFKSDYILINNIWARLSVTVSCAVVFGCYILMQIFLYLSEYQKFDLYVSVISCAAIYIGLMVVYTIISADISRRRYNEAQRRLFEYNKLITMLDNNKKNTEVE